MTKYFLELNEEGRILSSTSNEEYKSDDMIEFDMPDDFDFTKQDDYLIVDGELVHDLRQPDPEFQILDLKRKLSETDYAVIKVYETMVTGVPLPDEDAERYADLIVQRREWREQINQLEASLKGSEGENG